MKKRKILTALVVAASIMAITVIPSLASESDNPYPLQGTFPYTEITKESIDQKIAEGWVFSGNPYDTVGDCMPFTNNKEWAQVNSFHGNQHELNYSKVLITLAGLKPQPDVITGFELNAYENQVKDAIVKYLNSYDWKQASDYEKALYTAEYIAAKCEYKVIEGNGTEHNSVYSALVRGYAACDGFAQAYHILTRAVGLKSVQITNHFHAFNYVQINGIWRDIDISYVAGFDNKQTVIKELLAEDAVNSDKHLWEKTLELQFDATLPEQPLY